MGVRLRSTCIQSLEKMIGEKANRMSFRSPEKGTENYFFTLYNNRDEIIYAKRSIDGDSYNIGFHRAISYRENCYHCRFACPERVSDITLGDYHGLGKAMFLFREKGFYYSHSYQQRTTTGRLIDNKRNHLCRRTSHIGISEWRCATTSSISKDC